jgi:hypothetical protein
MLALNEQPWLTINQIQLKKELGKQLLLGLARG